MTRVSITIPVYNRTTYLDETITSVRAQTLGDWQLWVVDDGSDIDISRHVLTIADPRIHFLRQSNQGNAAARNTGIQHGEGEYIACLDSDDVWHPRFLQTCVEYLTTRPDIDVVYTQVEYIDADSQPLPLRSGPEPRIGDLLPDLLMGYPILPSSAVIRRQCFKRWGLFTPGLDDWELWLRWAALGCRFACIEPPLLRYRIHDQNFNLVYGRRRAAHFAMLDKFYGQEHLPESAYILRERAYANQHFQFAVLAWQLGQPAEGISEFTAAVLRHPAYLVDLDFYTRIACAHQGRIDAGQSRRLDLSQAESSLNECLMALFVRPDLPSELGARRDEAYGWAYLALARLAYGVAHDMSQGRRWLWRALRAAPTLAWHGDWFPWAARSFAGYRQIGVAKRLLGRGGHHG